MKLPDERVFILTPDDDPEVDCDIKAIKDRYKADGVLMIVVRAKQGMPLATPEKPRSRLAIYIEPDYYLELADKLDEVARQIRQKNDLLQTMVLLDSVGRQLQTIPSNISYRCPCGKPISVGCYCSEQCQSEDQ